jgi:hypothetical protein
MMRREDLVLLFAFALQVAWNEYAEDIRVILTE